MTQDPGKNLLTVFKEYVKDNLYRYYPDVNFSNPVLNGKYLGGQFAKTYRLRIQDKKFDKTVFVKTTPIYDSLNPAISEYNLLTEVFPVISLDESNLAVARPLDFLSEYNAYIQESVGNSTFRTFLLAHNTKNQDNKVEEALLKNIKGSALWLHSFHKLTSYPEKETFKIETFIESFDEEYDYKKMQDFGINPAIVQNLLDEISNKNSDLEMNTAKWHWDYTPGHVYLDNNKFSVIDIGGFERTSIFEDIGRFLAAMTSLNNFPFHLSYDYDRANNLFSSVFIKEYFGPEIKESDFCLSNLYKLKYQIIFLLDQYNQISNRLGKNAGKLFVHFWLKNRYDVLINDTITQVRKHLNLVQ